MQNIVLILVLLTVGWLLQRLVALRTSHPGTREWIFQVPGDLGASLTAFVIWVSLPAMVLLKIPSLEFSPGLLTPVVMPWVMLVVSAAAVLMLSRVRGWGRDTTGVLLLLVPLANTSFIGIPMVTAFFGADHVPYILLYDQLGTFLAIATYGAVIAALYGNGGTSERPGAVTILKKVVAFPPFVAIVLALATRGIGYPAMVVAILEPLAGALVPLVITAVGFSISFHIPRAHLEPLGAALLLKLIAAPLLALVGCRVLGLVDPIAKVSVFEAGMPPSISAWAVARNAGLDAKLAAAIVGLGILLSLVTLPGLYQLL